MSECNALVALYNSTNGSGWTDNTGWLANNTPCLWFGVTCSGGSVIKIDLEFNQLSGSIPPGLGSLTNLAELWLTSNQLTGSIPPELDKLKNLTDLWLDGNQLTGSIPAELGNLSNLQNLELDYNQLTGIIPSELGKLTNLEDLWLSDNPLTSGSIPSWLGNLTNLQFLGLDGIQLTGDIPTELGSLVKLTQLSLSNNQLSGNVPSWLYNLTYLQYLNLNGNQLTGSIPSGLGNLTNLTFLYLNNNQLTGPLPPSIINLNYLNTIRMGGISNTLDSATTDEPIRSFLSSKDINWTYATPIYLCTGVTEIPIIECTALEALYNSTNGSEWVNDTGWEVMNTPCSWFGITCSGSRVTQINLSNNQLTGTIPFQLGNLPNLKYLYLNYNQLGDGIPPQLGNLSNLTRLVLSSNQLIGNIPTLLGNLTSLTQLDLSYNQLSGSIPTQLGSLTNLTLLYLHNNQLTGPLPSEITNLNALNYVRMGGGTNSLDSATIDVTIRNFLTSKDINWISASSLSPMSANFLLNPGFENGFTNWTWGLPCSQSILGVDSMEGTNHLVTSKSSGYPNCLSVWQEFYTTINVGQSYTFGVWLRSPWSPQTIPIALWFTGSPGGANAYHSANNVSIDNTWQCFQTTLYIDRINLNNRLKVEIYLPNINLDVNIDGVYLGSGQVQYCP
jgi:Leucine-rich repeat (LRR) protein